MRRLFLARQMNQQLRRDDMEQLSVGAVDYASGVVGGLHRALLAQAEPTYRRPEQPIDGWGLTDTPLERRGALGGINIVALVGRRAVYLSTEPNIMYRVLTVPHRRIAFEEEVVQVRTTTVPDLLREDPTLYYGMLNAVGDTVKELGIDYDVPLLPDELL